MNATYTMANIADSDISTPESLAEVLINHPVATLTKSTFRKLRNELRFYKDTDGEYVFSWDDIGGNTAVAHFSINYRKKVDLDDGEELFVVTATSSPF